MPKIDPYQTRAADYDHWFERHPYVYQAELAAVRKLIPTVGRGVEVGVGTGRFAQPLGVTIGIDPSPAMMKFAVARNIDLVTGTAEYLPLRSAACDFITMITILHLLDDASAAIHECYRALVPAGHIIIAFIERDSPMGREYHRGSGRDDSEGYFREVRFFSGYEILEMLRASGFRSPISAQTIFRPVAEITGPEPVEPGHGRGSFVVVRAEKPA